MVIFSEQQLKVENNNCAQNFTNRTKGFKTRSKNSGFGKQLFFFDWDKGRGKLSESDIMILGGLLDILMTQGYQIFDFI